MAWNGVGEKKDEKKSTEKTVEVHPARTANKNMAGGMEMLQLEFLAGVIDNTQGNESNDVTMRKLAFDDVLRRDKQDAISSEALTVYAVDGDDLYGKNLQCAAMKELTKRTS